MPTLTKSIYKEKQMAEPNVTQIATPSEAVKLDRATAAKINPLIGDLGIKDTLEHVPGSSGSSAVWWAIPISRAATCSAFLKPVSAALNWELKNMMEKPHV